MIASKEMCSHCFDVIISNISKNPTTIPRLVSLDSVQCPLFVTLHTVGRNGDKDLRGCIGTLSPTSLGMALQSYAIASAFKDTRFSPLESHELQNLILSVSLLVDYENGADYLDWMVGKHGIIIEFEATGRRYNATYLPEVASEQEWTQHQTILSLVKKAGYRGDVTDVILQRIQLTRYQSSKCHLSYTEYAAQK